MATGRPAVAAGEVRAVRQALSAMPAGLSVRARGALLARRVVARLITLNRADLEPFEAALAELRGVATADPVHELVRAADFGVERLLAAERLRRFESRGCRQLAGEDWEQETDDIAATLEKRLARRYRRLCEKVAAN